MDITAEKKKRIRKTLQQQIESRQEKIAHEKAALSLLKRKQQAQKRRQRARLMFQIAEIVVKEKNIDLKPLLDDPAKNDHAEKQVIREKFLEKFKNQLSSVPAPAPAPVPAPAPDDLNTLFISMVGKTLLFRLCGFTDKDLPSLDKEKFLRFLSKTAVLMTRRKNYQEDGEYGRYWDFWSNYWKSYSTHPENLFTFTTSTKSK